MTEYAVPNHDTASLRARVRRVEKVGGILATSEASMRNAILDQLAKRLETDAGAILSANAEDVVDARRAVEQGTLTASAVDRLALDATKLRGMIAGVRSVAALDDPLRRVLARRHLDDGLDLEQITVPFGLIAAIFESRPDAVVQIAALAVKSGNAAILKGGREAYRSTAALVHCVRAALAESLPALADAVISVQGYDTVDALLTMDDLIDLIIPRGSTTFVRSIQARTRIPVLGHAAGVCHVYLHASADPAMATAVTYDSKVQYPAACNAAETLLVDAVAAETLLPPVVKRLLAAGVEVRGCERTRSTLAVCGLGDKTQDTRGTLVCASDDDWDAEYGALVMACRVVEGIDQALAHIRTHGSRHTEAIVTNDPAAAARFLAEVDAAGVFHNASTRFADGYRYGLGAEVGVSTSKLHVRGPVGLEGLTTTKYILRGHGHAVADYSGPGARTFLHAR